MEMWYMLFILWLRFWQVSQDDDPGWGMAVVHVNDHFGVGVGMGVGGMLYLIPNGVLCSVWLRLSHLESNWTAIG